ncbi:phosphatidylserine decarboxylase [candidate division FCPU426 bacterium]|nr:phosphatidylserine decarboxylase [candidate division FCPU426 bacterium]
MKYFFNKSSVKIIAFLAVMMMAGILLLLLQPLHLALFGWMLVASGVFLTALVVYFCRDPERHSAAADDCLVAPADGLVVRVEEVMEDKHLRGRARRIAIFMHVGNVHVQRVPSSGILRWTEHRPGKFWPVLHPQAARENEQRWYAFENKGCNYVLVQIAGMLAKRTISWCTTDSFYRRGERLGMIALGSEVDLYLPTHASVAVKVGDKVVAGQTIIGRWQACPKDQA